MESERVSQRERESEIIIFNFALTVVAYQFFVCLFGIGLKNIFNALKCE